MKVTVFAIPVLAALMLAGCFGGPQHHARRTGGSGGAGDGMPPPRLAKAAPAERFACENGLSIYIRRVDGDRIDLSLDDKRTRMAQASSGSGVRYVSSSGLFGRGAEWHQKASEGFLSFVDPYGNQVDTVCRLAR